jgi:hypothetical protein
LNAHLGATTVWQFHSFPLLFFTSYFSTYTPCYFQLPHLAY